jgi:8-O-methyltransferase
MTSHDPVIGRIRQLCEGWACAQAMFAALELGVFAELGKGPRTAAQLRRALGLRASAVVDFLDTLVATGLLEREGDDTRAVYVNTRESAFLLDPRSRHYLRALPLLADSAGTARWSRLAGALRGEESPARDAAELPPPAAEIAIEPVAELCLSLGLRSDALLLDAGGALTAALTQRPGGLRVAVPPRDLPWPQADAVVVVAQLQRLAVVQRQALLHRAYAALAPGGWLLVADLLVDDARRAHVAALQAALDRWLGGADGESLSAAEVEQACAACGFARVERHPLDGVASAVIAHR